MKTPRWLGLAFFIFTIIFVAPGAAQVPMAGTRGSGLERAHTISGWVRLFSEGTPAASVRVVLSIYPERMVASTLTSGSGFFEFSHVPDGEYQVTIEDMHYWAVQQPVSVRADRVDNLQIHVRKAMTAPAGHGGAIVSVRDLSRSHKAQEAMREGLDLLYGKSDYRGSLGQFERAIREDPGYYEAYAQAGVAQMFMKNFADSEAALRKAVELSRGRNADAYFLLAGLFSNTGRFADAEPMARQATEIDPERWQAHSELARALLGLNHPQEAEASAAKAVQMQPESPSLYLLLADIHIALQNRNALLDDLENYLRLAPNGAMADQARKTRADLERSAAEAGTAVPSSPATK